MKLTDSCRRALVYLPLGSSSLAKVSVLPTSFIPLAFPCAALEPGAQPAARCYCRLSFTVLLCKLEKKLPFLWAVAALYQAHRLASGVRGGVQPPLPLPHPGQSILVQGTTSTPAGGGPGHKLLRGSLTPLQMATASLDMDFG